METLLKKVKELPLSPGCYLFKNKDNEIIYIGKSKALRNRVRQYFQNVDAKEGKYIQLYKETKDFDFILTETETDALILECQMVKRMQPKFNAALKRTKKYPYIKINRSQSYPTLSVSLTAVENDGNNYFGFFYNPDEAFANIQLINRVWHTPVCGKEKFPKNHRACLNLHMGKCCAPCEKRISIEEYSEIIDEITKCLKGSFTGVIRRLKKEMAEASAEYNFELAARRRDEIEGIEHLSRKSKRLNTLLKNRDVFLFFRAFNEKAFTVFFIRGGRTLVSKRIQNNEEQKVELLEELVSEVKNHEFVTEGSEFLTTCLIDIFADKLYLPVTNRMRASTILRLLEENMEEFLSEEE